MHLKTKECIPAKAFFLPKLSADGSGWGVSANNLSSQVNYNHVNNRERLGKIVQ